MTSLAVVAWQQWGIADKNAAKAKENEEEAKSNAATAKTNEGEARRNAATAKGNEIKALRTLSASLAAQSAAVRNEFPQRSVLLSYEAVSRYRVNKLSPLA